MTQVVRLQVEINKEDLDELEKLRELGGLRTKKELWDNAFTLLKWATKTKARGASIFSVKEDEGSYKELEMPFLERFSVQVNAKPSRDPVLAGIAGRSNSVANTKAINDKRGNKLSFAKRKITA